MKKLLMLIPIFLIFSSVFAQDFCGSSTSGSCNSSADCNTGGCGGEVCERKGEGTISNCILKDCYAATKYGLSCQCVNSKCQWADKNGKPYTPTTTSPIVSMLKVVYNYLISFNPILLIILGIILIVVSKLAKIVGIILIIVALIHLILLFLH